MAACCWLLVITLGFALTDVHSLQFTYDTYDAYISLSTQPDTPIQQLVAIPSGKCHQAPESSLQYHIEGSGDLRVNETTGDISVLSTVSLSKLLSLNNDTVTYIVTASCQSIQVTAVLRVHMTSDSCVCFPTSDLQLTLGDQITPYRPPYGLLYLDTGRCGERAYSLTSNVVGLQIVGNRLLITEDGNLPMTVSAVVSCDQSNNGLSVIVNQTELVFTKPYILKQGLIKNYFFQYNVTVDPEQITPELDTTYEAPLFSADGGSNVIPQWSLMKLNDETNQFIVSQPTLFHKTKKMSLYRIVVKWADSVRVNRSKDIDIIVFDKKLLDPSAAHLRLTNNVTYRISLTYNNVDELNSLDLPPEYHISIDRSAPYATQVLRIEHKIAGNALQFSLIPNNDTCMNFLSITPHQGIIYISNETALNSCAAAKQSLTLIVTQNRETRMSIINVLLTDERESVGNSSTIPSSTFSCAAYKNKEDCESSSGLGTHTCKWKTVTDKRSNYSTCVSSLSCADYECSELESLDKRLCPQDCYDDWYGNHRKECGLVYTGICKAEGVCFCNTNGEYCQCQHEAHVYIDDEDYNVASGDQENRNDGAIHGGTLNEPVCDMMCTVSISVAGALTILLIVILSLWCHFKAIKRHRKGQSINAWRANGNNLHLTFTPCPDYEQSTPTTIVSSLPDWPDAVHSYHNSVSMELYDPQWELDRANLLLEDYIGEGEFGRVMKAKYRQTSSGPWFPVAVKMLKDGASRTEYRDLLSEYNLLKEVDHPNVIKLIGAATINGPFHLVVEYCEHGSLKNLLRKIHFGEPTYVNSQSQLQAQYAALLLSYAYQISKGMQYLTGIKLVHRDLATRNILIAAENVIKISDFGMTKDIYEEDAYKKKSQGRIPVKWMAPESLYRHIYTSKSDVWSFGVLLWEIATLGATPYPGIPAERMCQLLQDGYRMEKPESCSTALYSIMRQCWNYDPVCRPSFRDLSTSLEKLINDKPECLNLSLAHSQRMCAGLSSSSSTSTSSEDMLEPTEALLAPQTDISTKFIEDYEVSDAAWSDDQKQTNAHRYTVLDLEEE